jgi:Uma2 family endonuclease
MVAGTRLIILGPEFDTFVDDDEETLVGSSFHQDGINGTYDSVRNYRDRHDLPWFVGNQIKLFIPRRDGLPAAAPSPDILIHPTLGVEGRYSLSLATDGPPGLVMEFLSPATARNRDLNTQSTEGKPHLYESCGIPEYLTFDPLSDYVPGQVRAWRLGPAGVYVPWEPDAEGHWVSAVLGISFVPSGRWLDVYDGQRQRIPRNEDVNRLQDEAAELRAERDRALREQERIARENSALREELRRLRGE